MIARLLVANRGEIACRIMRTARRMGVGTVAVFSDPDADAAHVRMADRSMRIGPADARESYLNIDAVIAAAKEGGSDAIHPGYGFLSESAAFAARCEQEGIVFVGPPAAAIRLAGSKVESKRTAAEAGIPVIPGFSVGSEADAGRLAEQADEIGFPLLIKASAGGGGRGIRLVGAPEELADAVRQAAREAEAGFGDAAVFAEKALAGARHIEVQVLADRSGRTVAVGDRDCSLQRRRQKVVEECPAPNLPAATREALHDEARRLAAKIGYRNAGTVEFLVDESGAHHFLEMNARLQVEHPATELAHRLDLVEWQLRIAAGEELPEDFPPAPEGCAIEARICAEIPERGFVPAVGKCGPVRWPADAAGATVRVDSGIEAGDRAVEHYDSLVAKVIAHHTGGREACLAAMRAALGEVRIGGVPTNLPYLRALLDLRPFASGRHTIGLLAEETDGLVEKCLLQAAEAMCLAAAGWLRRADSWNALAGFRLNSRTARALVEATDGVRTAELLVEAAWEEGAVHIVSGEGGNDMLLSGVKFRGSLVRAAIGGKRVEAECRVRRQADGWSASVRHAGVWRHVSLRGVLGARETRPAQVRPDEGSVTAPMHGRLSAVNVRAGDTVRRGDTVALLEAMKMEVPVKAAAARTVREVVRAAGEQVSMGDVLVKMDGREED